MIWWMACAAPDPRPDLDAPLACAPGCARAESARAAWSAGVRWLTRVTADPSVPVSVDLYVALAPTARRFRSAALDQLLVQLRDRADRPGDPRRRAWDPSARLAENPSASWSAAPGATLHPNRALVEALYCPEHGMRPETVRWLCEDWRDAGGPASAHAAWFLSLAVGQGCTPRSETCLDALVTELVTAAHAEPAPVGTEDRDRLAEQLLFARLGGAPPATLGAEVDQLVASQRQDGAFAAPADPESRWAVVHATVASVWALSEWLAADQQPSSSAKSSKSSGSSGHSSVSSR
ncbi:MAG: hypothetical protein ABMA64_12825 [Myxococcota bacterium]